MDNLLNAHIEVLIATYNRAPYIAETLESVLNQGEDVLVRIEDDGSTDETAEVIHPFLSSGRVFYAWHPPSGGPARPRNRALQAARAPYVTFFDADDLMQPGHLAHHIALLEEHPRWPAVIADYRNFNTEGDYPHTLFQSCPRLRAALALQGVELEGPVACGVLNEREGKLIASVENFSSACGVVYRRHAAQALGGFDEELPASEDFDLFWRLLGLGSLGVSTFCAFRRRMHSGNMSLGDLKILTWKVRSRLKLLANETDPLVRRQLKNLLAEFLDALAYHQMPVDTLAGLGSMCGALRYGVTRGKLPVQGLKSLARTYLKHHPAHSRF